MLERQFLPLASRFLLSARVSELLGLTTHKFRTGLTGLEPATSAVTGRCSNQLNYSPLFGNFAIIAIYFLLVKCFGVRN